MNSIHDVYRFMTKASDSLPLVDYIPRMYTVHNLHNEHKSQVNYLEMPLFSTKLCSLCMCLFINCNVFI